jgi:hypothetical protein
MRTSHILRSTINLGTLWEGRRKQVACACTQVLINCEIPHPFFSRGPYS